jgi:hypothetical protein
MTDTKIRGWKGIAAALSVSERTVRDWEAEGCFRDGKDLLPVREDHHGAYINGDALEAWKERQDMTHRAARSIRGQRRAG